MNSTLLLHLLREKGVDCSAWGKNGNKTVDDLALELEKGDSLLIITDKELIRRTKVATADILYTDDSGEKWRLKEEKQILSNGTERKREKPQSISEKVLSGKKDIRETIIAGLLRGIKEELGIILEDTDIARPLKGKKSGCTVFTGTRREVEDGRSYPKLKTVYKLTDFQLLLPKKHYKSEGYIEKNKNGTTTYFIWERFDRSSPQSSAE